MTIKVVGVSQYSRNCAHGYVGGRGRERAGAPESADLVAECGYEGYDWTAKTPPNGLSAVNAVKVGRVWIDKREL